MYFLKSFKIYKSILQKILTKYFLGAIMIYHGFEGKSNRQQKATERRIKAENPSLKAPMKTAPEPYATSVTPTAL